MKLLLAMIAGLSLTGCVTTGISPEKVRSESLAKSSCTLHEEPLIKITCYEGSAYDARIPSEYLQELFRQFPNAIPIGYRLKPLPGKPGKMEIAYCETCDDSIHARANRYGE